MREPLAKGRGRAEGTSADSFDLRVRLWCGGPTGYGLAAAALAEATDGVIASFDSAFDVEHNGESAEQFLAWWGDKQINFYGPERFLAARKPS